MADIHYYVSQQHGNDSNTGLSEAQAWATLTKAAQTVQTPDAGNRHRIHWGPGTYREKISFSYAGRSVTENITYEPDPNCLWLTNDKPGRCRITGCDANEVASSGKVVDWNSKNYVQFGCAEAECWVDGVKDYALAAVLNGSGCIMLRVNAQSGYTGILYGVCDNCTSQGGYSGFQSNVNTNCTALGGNTGFLSGTATNCVARGNSYGFSGISVANCAAIGNGSSGFVSCTAANCVTLSGSSGFQSGTATNCVARGNSYGFNGGGVYACAVAGCKNNINSAPSGDGAVTEGATAVGRIDEMPYMPKGIQQAGWWLRDTYNETVTGATLDLASERLIAFTPTKTGTSKGMAVYIEAKAASGSVTCELQKKVSGSWSTQKSKTLAVSNLTNTKMNRFEWDMGSGDDQLTAASDTWRYRITADTDAQSTTIRTSNGTAVSYQGYFWPDSMPNTDIDGRPRCAYGTYPSIGPWEPPDMTEEWTTYKTTAPAIKLTGNSMHIMKVAAAKDKAITVKWWIRHHGTAADKKPQIWLKGPGLTTQTATCTAVADTWVQVSVSITPTRDTVLDVCLYARDPATGAYSIFSDPEVS